jgi:hypothetical protein
MRGGDVFHSKTISRVDRVLLTLAIAHMLRQSSFALLVIFSAPSFLSFAGNFFYLPFCILRPRPQQSKLEFQALCFCQHRWVWGDCQIQSALNQQSKLSRSIAQCVADWMWHEELWELFSAVSNSDSLYLKKLDSNQHFWGKADGCPSRAPINH